MWSNGENNQQIIVSTQGDYFVTVKDANGCEAISNTVTVEAYPSPTAPTISSSSTSICEGESITLSSSSSVDYEWSNGATTQNIEVDEGGSYYVTITDVNGCSSTSLITTITKYDLPIVSIDTAGPICSDDEITLVGTPSGGVFGGANIQGNVFNPANQAGLFDVTYAYTDGNGCENTTSITILVEDCDNATINEYYSLEFELFPNPSSGQVTLRFNSLSNSILEISDLSGKVVFTQSMNDMVNELDFSYFAPGMYLFTLKNSSFSNTIRWIKN